MTVGNEGFSSGSLSRPKCNDPGVDWHLRGASQYMYIYIYDVNTANWMDYTLPSPAFNRNPQKSIDIMVAIEIPSPQTFPKTN